MTSAEKALWRALRAHRFHGLHFRRQVPCGFYIADFLCRSKMLVIEVDGATHSTESELRYDDKRENWFLSQGYAVVRFSNDEIYKNLAGVLETTFHKLALADSEPPPQPSPATAGEGE